MKKTVCELFAGVGGFRLGLERSSKDWKTVWANQWEPSRKSQWAFECYVENFCENKNKEEIYSNKKNDDGISPWNDINISKVRDDAINEWSNVDIAKVDTNNIPEHNLLVGGFPCQDYSVARTKAEGLKGKKGVLWWEIERILKDKRPSFVLLENVDRLIKSRNGRDFGVILACFNNLGYNVQWRVINAADYGFRQKRRRVFIFASKLENNYSKEILDGEVKNILKKDGFFSSTFPLKEIDQIFESKLATDLVEVSDNFKFSFVNSGLMKEGRIYSAKAYPVELEKDKVATIKDILEEEVDEEYFLTEEELKDWEYMKGAKAIERVSKSGHKYTFREGAIAFPDPIDKPARTMLTSESSKNRSSHVINDPKTGRLRKLTPNECDQLNHFPKGWTNTKTISNSFRYFCMGNALVVGLIEKMGERLNQIIKNED